ncbi:MAG: NAD-dependent epimerase/dehydratase family protein [Rhodothalassiaceae bacterium]
MKTVALTGGTGFLGAHCVAALKGRAKLRLLSRRPRPDGEGLEHVIGTLADREALRTLVTGADAVLHVAGAVKARDRDEFFMVNRDGTAELLAAVADKAPQARIVHVSSLAARVPGLSPYAASKAAAEDLAHDAGAIILRPPGIYGPGDLEILKLIRAAQKGILPVPGSRVHRVSLIHARDLARLIATLALAETAPAGVHEVDDGQPRGYSYDELALLLGEALGRRVRPLVVPRALLLAAGHAYGLTARLRGTADIFGPGKARELLHPDWSIAASGSAVLASLWTPETGFAEGIKEAILWAQSHGHLPNDASES